MEATKRKQLLNRVHHWIYVRAGGQKRGPKTQERYSKFLEMIWAHEFLIESKKEYEQREIEFCNLLKYFQKSGFVIPEKIQPPVKPGLIEKFKITIKNKIGEFKK